MASEDPLIRATRDFLATHRVSRETFAVQTRLGKSTLDKFLIGQFSDKTAAIVANAIGYHVPREGIADHAAPSLGGYAREAAEVYLGTYLFLRPDFRDPQTIAAFRMEIDWDESMPGLRIRGLADGRFEKFGHIAMPRGSMYVAVQHNEQGWCSLTMLSYIDGEDRMYGGMLAMGNPIGNTFLPMVMPVVLNKTAPSADDLGRIGRDHPRNAAYRALLARAIDEQHVRPAFFGDR